MSRGGAERVPWRRSLFLTIFASGAVVAIIAVAAATWVTVRSTTVAVQEQQQRSLHTESTVLDALQGWAATHASWQDAGPLVKSLAATAGQRVVVASPRGEVLADSSGEPRGEVDPTRATATVDALHVDPAAPTTVGPTSSGQITSGPDSAERPSPACVAGCARQVVDVPLRVDHRALTRFTDRASPSWSRLEARVSACLQARDVARDVALEVGLADTFSVVVAGPAAPARPEEVRPDAARSEAARVERVVADCVETSVVAMVSPDVAPRALLVMGDGTRAALSWDLSGAGRWRVVALAGVVLGVTVLLSALVAGYVVGPLRRLATAARLAADGDLTVRVPEGRSDELGVTGRAFNQMTERREQLEVARRRLATDVSHELRTPISNVRGWLEAAQDGLVDLDQEWLASLHEETVHLQRLVEDLHQLSLGDVGALTLHRETFPLEALVSSVLAGFQGTADQAGVRLESAVASAALVRADPVRLRQVLANLVANALRHTPAGGSVRITLDTDRLTVSDTGTGIGPEDLPHVFDRFRRVDASRSRATGGSGLGLAIVRQTVEAHGWTVDLDSTPGQGTWVTVHLDRTDEQLPDGTDGTTGRRTPS